MPSEDALASIPFPTQPVPIGLIVADVPLAAPVQTVIVREWAEGEARRCTLCPRHLCSFTRRGTCMVLAPGIVARGDARLYRLLG